MDREKGAKLSRLALEEAREIDEVGLEVQAHWNLILALGFQIGQEEEALNHGEAGLELADKHQKDELRAYLRNDLGRINVFCGNLERGETLVKEALDLWHARENNPMVVDSLMTLSLLRLLAGRFSDYPAITAEAQALAGEIGNDWARAYSLMMTDRYFFVTGRFGRALTRAHAALKQGGKINFIAGLAMSNIVLATIFIELGRYEEALARASHALQALGGAHHPFADEALAVQAMVHVRRGDLSLAEEILSTARFELLGDEGGRCLSIGSVPVKLAKAELDLAHGQLDQTHRNLEALESRLEARGIRFYLPELLRMKGRTLMGMDEPEMAVSQLRKGRDLALTMGAKRELWHLQLALAEAEVMLGRTSVAEKIWRQAGGVVKGLAESLDGYPELQDSFYRQPAVKRVLEASS
jgi:tetratricopeptide (TPR) repeat protein